MLRGAAFLLLIRSKSENQSLVRQAPGRAPGLQEGGFSGNTLTRKILKSYVDSRHPVRLVSGAAPRPGAWQLTTFQARRGPSSYIKVAARYGVRTTVNTYHTRRTPCAS